MRVGTYAFPPCVRSVPRRDVPFLSYTPADGGSAFEAPGVAAFGLILGRRSLSGSAIGGLHITADVEVIPIQKVNETCERPLKSDVTYRFSIDMASLRSPA
jgi:hypothetical protein